MKQVPKNPFFQHPSRLSPAYCEAVSNEYGERLRQSILVMQQRYQGRWNAMKQFCWFVCRDGPELIKAKPKDSDFMKSSIDSLLIQPPDWYSVTNSGSNFHLKKKYDNTLSKCNLNLQFSFKFSEIKSFTYFMTQNLINIFPCHIRFNPLKIGKNWLMNFFWWSVFFVLFQSNAIRKWIFLRTLIFCTRGWRDRSVSNLTYLNLSGYRLSEIHFNCLFEMPPYFR